MSLELSVRLKACEIKLQCRYFCNVMEKVDLVAIPGTKRVKSQYPKENAEIKCAFSV